MGFLGTSLPAEKGGVGGTFLDEAIVLEEQVRVDSILNGKIGFFNFCIH